MKRYLLLGIVFCSLQLNAQTSLNPYCVQMHIHGISNHNGHDIPGSMQYHSFYADSTNLDVLWWSDHMHSFHQYNTSEFNFVNGVWNPGLSQVDGLTAADASEPLRWIVDKYIGTGTYNVSVTDSSLNLNINADNSGIIGYLEAYPRGKAQLLAGTGTFVRPLCSEPIFEFDLFATGLNSLTNRKVQYIIYLDYHAVNSKSRQEKIVYNFVDANTTPFSVSTTDSVTVTINKPVTNNSWNHLVLNIAADASYLLDGEDNVISDYHPRVESKNNASVTGKFANMNIYSLQQSNSHQWQKIRDFGNIYEARYSVKQYMGVEFSFDYLNNSKTHFNAFVPESLAVKNFMYDSSVYNTTAQAFVQTVKNAGGVVSYNHPFGAGRYVLGTTQFQDSLTNATALYMLGVNGFGSDLLEVGYLQRGDCDLEHHLLLWDKLTANSLFLYGTAVGDRHGGNWFTVDNNLSTWVQSEDSTSENLIKNMKKGRIFFGDNFKYNGNINMRVANAEMGDRAILQGTLAAPLDVIVKNPLQGSVFKYTHGLLKTGLNVTYLAYDVVFDPQHPPVLDLSQSSFVRVTVYDNTGKAYLCSNPIVLFTGNFTPWDNGPLSALPDPSELRITPTPDQHIKTVTVNLPNSVRLSTEIFDLNGKMVKQFGSKQFAEGETTFEIDVHHLSPAIYIVKMEGEGFSKTAKIAVSNVDLINGCQH